MENVLDRMKRIGADQKIADFNIKMSMNYDFKKKYAGARVHEFISECDGRGLNYHVSVGGLDSICLFLFIKSLGYDVPGISVSQLEDNSIQRVHKQLGIERLKPSVRYFDNEGGGTPMDETAGHSRIWFSGSFKRNCCQN